MSHLPNSVQSSTNLKRHCENAKKVFFFFLKRHNESQGAISCLTTGKLRTSAATEKRSLSSLRAYTSSGNPEAP